MRILNTTVIALTLVAAAATSAYAHQEFRDRDAVQGGTAAYYPNGNVETNAPARVVAPSARLNDAERAIVNQQVETDGN